MPSGTGPVPRGSRSPRGVFTSRLKGLSPTAPLSQLLQLFCPSSLTDRPPTGTRGCQRSPAPRGAQLRWGVPSLPPLFPMPSAGGCPRSSTHTPGRVPAPPGPSSQGTRRCPRGCPGMLPAPEPGGKRGHGIPSRRPPAQPLSHPPTSKGAVPPSCHPREAGSARVSPRDDDCSLIANKTNE